MCLAIPGKIESIKQTEDSVFKTAMISFGGIIKEVNLSMVPDAKKDEYVIVHAGIALNKIDEKEALKVLSYYKDTGELDEELKE